MKTYLFFIMLTVFTASLFCVSAHAVTEKWSYECANTNTVVQKIYADGKGG